MKDSLRIFIGLIIGINSVAAAFATQLPLTETEMQKLQRYFPVDTPQSVISVEILHHLWKGDPILIELPLNQEKRLVFSETVTVDVQGGLNTAQLRLLNNGQSLYLTALKNFSKTRINIQLQNSHQVIYVDLLSAAKASAQTEYIDVASEKASSLTSTTINNQTPDDIAATNTSADYPQLLRAAWQQLYAPERLITDTTALTRVPMRTDYFTPYLIYGDKVYAHPLISWEIHNTYITAIELRNKYSYNTTINVSNDLCGDWLTATLYPRNQLKPAGDINGDTTTLFVISSKPFADNLEECHA